MLRQPEQKINYLYGRLSHEDENKGDSYSIENQRKILSKYAEENGFIPYEFVYDDGYSGGDWTRPAFCKMIKEVEAGKVASVICKDLSRFGRGYLKVGFYQEVLFPSLDVRLVAIHDNVDSDEGENDFSPMINFFNEYYLKSTSQKIRAVQQAKGKSGERLAVIPPYGYRKGEDGKTLVVDEESAAVVERIFRLSVGGNGPAQIAKILNSERILNPSSYKYEHGILKKARACKDPYFWNTTTVHKILDAPEYLGHTINFKTFTKSYKDNKVRQTPIDQQLVFENTHPAIIDVETWDIVRSMRQHKRRSPRYGNPGLFSGVVYCSDCKSKLYYHTRAIWNKAKTVVRYDGSYSCSKYRKGVQYQEDRACTCHYIGGSQLEEIVTQEIRDLLAFITRNEKKFVRLVTDKSRQEQVKDIANMKRTAEKNRRRIAELDLLIERLYTDNVSGKVSDERYNKMSVKFEAEQTNLTASLAILEAKIFEQNEQATGVDRFIDTVRRYTEIKELTPAIVHEFIDRIIVHEPEQARGDRRQKVEIVYNKIGAVDLDSCQNTSTQN